MVICWYCQLDRGTYALQPFHTFLLTRILFLALASMSFVLLQGFGGMTSWPKQRFMEWPGMVRIGR